MPKPRMSKSKREALKEQGTLNPHPEKVRDERFLTEDFFDPQDLLQVKYEMLRRVRLEGASRSQAAAAFGFSRPAFYQAQARLEAQGVTGLMARRRGPKGGYKLSEAVMDFVEGELEGDPSLRTRALATRVEARFGIRTHPRSIERALERRQKKRR